MKTSKSEILMQKRARNRQNESKKGNKKKKKTCQRLPKPLIATYNASRSIRSTNLAIGSLTLGPVAQESCERRISDKVWQLSRTRHRGEDPRTRFTRVLLCFSGRWTLKALRSVANLSRDSDPISVDSVENDKLSLYTASQTTSLYRLQMLHKDSFLI